MCFVIDRQTDAPFDFKRFRKELFLKLEWPPVFAAVNSNLQWFDRARGFDLFAK